MDPIKITIVVSTAFMLLMGAIGVSKSKQEEPGLVHAEADTLQQWIVQKGDLEYQMAADLADSLIREKYEESGLVYRPRNFMITFLASQPALLDVTASWWLESVSTGMFQKCEGKVTIERGSRPEVVDPPGLWKIECE